MKLRTLIFNVLPLVLLLTGCGPQRAKEDRNPAPSSSLTKGEGLAVARRVVSAYPRLTVGTVAPTGSMAPTLDSRTVVIYENYLGQTIKPNDIVVFNRGDSPRVIHRVVEVNETHFFVSGDNNQHSDGWFPLTAIEWRVVGLLFTNGE